MPRQPYKYTGGVLSKIEVFCAFCDHDLDDAAYHSLNHTRVSIQQYPIQ